MHKCGEGEERLGEGGEQTRTSLHSHICKKEREEKSGIWEIFVISNIIVDDDSCCLLLLMCEMLLLVMVCGEEERKGTEKKEKTIVVSVDNDCVGQKNRNKKNDEMEKNIIKPQKRLDNKNKIKEDTCFEN
eukprot:UN01889